MGFHSLWFTEMVFSRGWTDGKGRDLFGVLPGAAAVTSRIRLGAAPLGDAASILSFAAETANMDILSSGRLTLGLSPGRWPDEGKRDGSRPRLAGRLLETITLLKKLWSEDQVSFKGSHNNLEGLQSTSSRSRLEASRSSLQASPARR